MDLILQYVNVTFVCLLMMLLLVLEGGKSRVRKYDSVYFIKIILWLMTLLSVYYFLLEIIGFRPFDAGDDTERYIKAFSSIDGISSARVIGNSVYGNTEIGFWYFQSLIKVFNDSARAWLVINISFVFLLIYFLYRKISHDLKVPVYIFVFVFFTYDLVYFGNAMRQSLALPLGLLSVFYFSRNEWSKYFIYVTLAVLLHWSAIIFFLLPFSSYLLKSSKWALVSMFVLLPLLSSVGLLVLYQVFLYVGVSEISEKLELYLFIRESHLPAIYKLFNFWLVVVVAFSVIFLSSTFRKYSFIWDSNGLFLFLILFGVAVPDVSERFFPAFFILMPAILYILVYECLFGRVYGSVVAREIVSFVYVSIFGLLCILVLNNESARITLGY